MTLIPYKYDVDEWKRMLGGNPVATVARAAATLKRQQGIKGGRQKPKPRQGKKEKKPPLKKGIKGKSQKKNVKQMNIGELG